MERYTPEQIQSLLDAAAREGNILPLTSRCDCRCVFCSHHNNPPQIRVVSIGTRTLAQIEESISFLDPRREVTIGESASSIIEGEPTLHPQFRQTFSLLRQRCPQAPVSITTNGRYLTEDLISFLAQKGPVTVNLSLNSGTLAGRQNLMGDTPEQAGTAIAAPALLGRYQVPFTGSLVGMPNRTGWADMEQSIRLLAQAGAQSVRVFLPGFSAAAPADLFPNPDEIYRRLKAFITPLAHRLPCPVLLEPSFVKDLTPVISGITAGSPAHKAGLRQGDVLTQINGQTPRSRTEAFSLLHRTPAVTASWRRDGVPFSAFWLNGPQGAGVTMEYDFDLDRAVYIKSTIHSAPGHVLAFNSAFGHDVFQAALTEVGAESGAYTAIVTPNRTFGGTIRCSGLLTVSDYLSAYEVYIKSNPKPGALLVPSESFNALGLDLTGRSWRELTRETGLAAALA